MNCQNIVSIGDLSLPPPTPPPKSAASVSRVSTFNNAKTIKTAVGDFKILKRSNEKTMSKKTKPEENFYENLTLGLKNTLTNVPRVCDVRCEMRQPCEKAQVVNWEQRHSVYLPEDMKKFYLSTDGFIFQWSYQYAADDTRRVGLIHFPHLLQITLLRENVETSSSGYATSSAAASSSSTTTIAAATNTGSSATHINAGTNIVLSMDMPQTSSLVLPPTAPAPLPQQTTSSQSNAKDQWGNPTPILTPKTKIFELNNINDVAKVCLVYESTGTSNPKIYLLELSDFRWQFLAESFSEYLRMSIAHLGLPYWELCFSSFGLPSWTEQLFLLLAPHLLEEHEPRRTRLISPSTEHPYNVIDPNIFRVKPKGTTKTSTTSKLK